MVEIEQNPESSEIIVEENLDNKDNFENQEAEDSGLTFVYINRIITNLLTSLISGGLVVASLFGVEAIFGNEAVANLDLRSVLVFLLLSSLGLYIGQVLQNYFVKIIEKESYKFVLGKTFKNFVWQVLLVAIFIPGLIYALSMGQEFVFWSVGIYVMISGLIAMSIREAEHSNRLQAGIFGGFVGLVFWLNFIFSLFTSGAETWKFGFIALLPITALLSEITIVIADMINQYIKD